MVLKLSENLTIAIKWLVTALFTFITFSYKRLVRFGFKPLHSSKTGSSVGFLRLTARWRVCTVSEQELVGARLGQSRVGFCRGSRVEGGKKVKFNGGQRS